jgi:hypothetical protein
MAGCRLTLEVMTIQRMDNVGVVVHTSPVVAVFSSDGRV